MLKPTANQEHGADLKEAFLRHLPERMGAIEEIWEDLVQGNWNRVKLTRLFQRIQDLAGSAGKFGLIQVSDRVFSLESRFGDLVASGARPEQPVLQEISSLIQGLKSVVDGVKRPLEADQLLKPQDRRARVFYLRLSDNLAPGLTGALESLDCAVERFQRVDDLIGAYDTATPAALVIDAQLLPGLRPLTERLAQLKARNETTPPLTVISGSSHLDIRLNSMRAGADAFFVTPIDTGAVAARIKHMASPEANRSFRVMIVDDDPSQADFAAAILRKADMETCAVTEPLQVLDTLDAFRPDLILMDLYMPDADGMELTSIIREQNEFVGVPIVFVSGEQDTDKQLDALSVGGDDFIAKPIRPRHLIATITNRIQRVRALQRQPSAHSRRDPATGLFNRRHFFERLDNALASATASGAQGVLYAELDGRDRIQSQIGADQSEALLAEIGSLLADATEPQDVCARMGDASFAVLSKRPLNKNLVQLAETLTHTVAAHRFESDRLQTQPTLSLGLCFLDASPDDASGLVNRATMSCAQAQAQGGNRVSVYGQGDTTPTEEAPSKPQDTLALVRDALRDSAFQVLFQPFVDLRDRQRENYEMMLRLRTPVGDQIGIADILPAAKQAGLLRDIDRWVAGRALEVLDERRQSGSEVRLLIGQTAATLADGDCAEWLRDGLRKRLLVGTGLILEFSLVDCAGDLKGARTLVADLKSMGIGVCLSRFGHNDASYKILQFLGAEFIKLGEKLLKADPRISSALVERVHKLGARVIVPRVDDPRLIGRHWLAGADFVQGNAIQRPQESPDYDFSEHAGT